MNREVKTFDFPTFEEWIERKCEWYKNIGVFYCSISPFCWSNNGTTYVVSIAANDNPSNMYVKKIYQDSIKDVIFKRDNDKLKQWFSSATEEANKKFIEYIEKTYLQS